jgi:uncharacterized membrane protein YhaH (DUF805 family)
MESYFAGWIKCFQFNGRSSRKEYWTFAIVHAVVYGLLGLIGGNSARSPRGGGSGGEIIQAFFWLAVLVPSFAITSRRLHDTNRTGWLSLLLFLPCIGPLILFLYSLLQGDQGENQYGPDPYETENGSPTYESVVPISAPLPRVRMETRPGDTTSASQTRRAAEHGRDTGAKMGPDQRASVSGSAAQSPDAPRRQHYDFAHVYLRDKALGSPATTVHELSGGNSLQYLEILWETAGQRSKDPED